MPIKETLRKIYAFVKRADIQDIAFRAPAYFQEVWFQPNTSLYPLQLYFKNSKMTVFLTLKYASKN